MSLQHFPAEIKVHARVFYFPLDAQQWRLQTTSIKFSSRRLGYLQVALAEGAVPSPLVGHAVNPSMPPKSPASDEGTAPGSLWVALLKKLHTDHLDWSLPAYRRGTLRGMDAA
ncbi:hypothetical protein LMG31886_40740 [Xanthomonas hydrangeae]|nr:hypothetical protein LMG31885_19650 [Xanthomonas hydrangeae]CAD7733427.1 hypothetical protein LMG31885_19650 [Xanthomonas hydrangeae]CAD7746423.1 hypothetical protein LMG31886_40740 [Xanthomonas hydrangeae]CAD7746425.1 hypothetical protein LMG31886_40740 [Xanthomonas hydrangeae]